MTIYAYRAVRIRQTASSNWLVLFGAPATHIDAWAGAPQKKELGREETTGFQRDINKSRLNSLKDFYKDEHNIIQNPLLCATRDTSKPMVRFLSDSSSATLATLASDSSGADAHNPEIGTIHIETETLESRSLLDLLRRVKAELERRVPTLKGHKISSQRVSQLKQEIMSINSVADDSNDDDLIDKDEADPPLSPDTSSEPDAAAVVFSDESHIFDFWEDIAARIVVLEELGPEFRSENTFAGYSKDAMISFLQPVVIVDGQHRLRGAVDAARELTSQKPFSTEIEKAVNSGQDPSEVQREAEARASRVLPVSLLMTDDPAEHVFQFVVVNQKAMPIDRALLGTIVSTSLSNDELARVSQRLSDAGIPLEESRSIAFLTRNPESPFYNLVQRGLESDDEGLMPWGVLGSIIRIFQDLKGGRLYGWKNDHADIWRRNHLKDSPLVADAEEHGYEAPYSYWKSPDGPWRQVFVVFWRSVRDKFATTIDQEAPNYWGAARRSNIFNKISLTILASDFFQYLCDAKRTIESYEQVHDLVEDWLKDVSPSYFNRDWNLAGVKKDSTGIRNRWAKIWVEYRKDPQRLPALKLYRSPLAGD